MYNNFLPRNNYLNSYNNYLPQTNFNNPYQQPQTLMPTQQVMPQNNMQMQNGNYSVIPVASKDEAKAVQTNFDGSITILPDFNAGRIYTKRLNMNTGASIFTEYKIDTPVFDNNTVAPVDDIDLPENKKKSNVKYVKEEDFIALKNSHELLKKEIADTIKSLSTVNNQNTKIDLSNDNKNNTKK